MTFHAIGEDGGRDGSEAQTAQQEYYGQYSQGKTLNEIEEVARNSQENTIRIMSNLFRSTQ